MGNESYIVDHCMVCGLGVGNQAVISKIAQQQTAVQWNKKWKIPLSVFPNEWFNQKASYLLPQNYSDLQQHLIAFIKYWSDQSEVCAQVLNHSEKSAIIWSTTKAGIGEGTYNLTEFLAPIAEYFGWKEEQQMVVSTACVSGVLAIEEAHHWLNRNSALDQIVVIGVDFISSFVIQGFQSFKALSPEICLPFHSARQGLNIGEAMAGIIVSQKPSKAPYAKILGTGSTNDANHLSGPSRTGEELGKAIQLTGVHDYPLDFVLLHGTGTVYNDEMECNALFNQSLSHIPFWSPKYYFGHSLGASGVLEVALALALLSENINLVHPYFQQNGDIIHEMKQYIMNPIQTTVTFLKTAAGFGGCNAAILLQWVKGE